MNILTRMTEEQKNRLLTGNKETRDALALEVGVTSKTLTNAIPELKRQQSILPAQPVTNLPTSLPVMGYTISWQLRAANDETIPHAALLELLAQNGFSEHSPNEPGEKRCMQRAITEWVKARSGPTSAGEEVQERSLTRKIESDTHTTWVLLREYADMIDMALDHTTEIRVTLEKVTKAQRAQGQSAAYAVSMSVRGDVVAQANGPLTAELGQHYATKLDRHQVSDLSPLITDIVRSLGAVALRDGGGLYFVRSERAQDIAQFQQFVNAMPGASYVLTLPVIDEPAARLQMEHALYDGLSGELDVLQADLARFNGRALRQDGRAIAERIVKYQEVKAKAASYGAVLAGRMSELDARVSALTAQARALLTFESAPEPVSEPESTPEPVGEPEGELDEPVSTRRKRTRRVAGDIAFR